jgi:hypothetical protein
MSGLGTVRQARQSVLKRRASGDAIDLAVQPLGSQQIAHPAMCERVLATVGEPIQAVAVRFAVSPSYV